MVTKEVFNGIFCRVNSDRKCEAKSTPSYDYCSVNSSRSRCERSGTLSRAFCYFYVDENSSGVSKCKARALFSPYVEDLSLLRQQAAYEVLVEELAADPGNNEGPPPSSVDEFEEISYGEQTYTS